MLGIYPSDRTVWCVEMVWVVGLWAIGIRNLESSFLRT